MTPAKGDGERIRVMRIIARLNVGGPAIQALTLTERLSHLGYDTTLIRGREGAREGSMDDLARELGVRPVFFSLLRRELRPGDLLALLQMTKLMRALKPHVVHTHAAKAGTLGRLACLLAGTAGPTVTVHTFHGHVLSEYFSPLATSLFRGIERGLAHGTSKLIAVSDEVRDDLLRLGVGRPDQVVVIPLGFDLQRFHVEGREHQAARERMRAAWAIPLDARVIVLVARLVPIKRVDRYLRIAQRLASDTDATFVVVGDGELHTELQHSPAALALGKRLIWAGIQNDMPAVMAAADVVVLTSDNEGTPVSLIEAQAAGRPVVSTAVGGVSSVVVDGQTGYIVARDDELGFANRVRALLEDGRRAAAFARAGRQRAGERFHVDRLVRDIDGLYQELLDRGP